MGVFEEILPEHKVGELLDSEVDSDSDVGDALGLVEATNKVSPEGHSCGGVMEAAELCGVKLGVGGFIPGDEVLEVMQPDSVFVGGQAEEEALRVN